MSGVPVGTILAFAGEPTQDLQSQGWLVCSGRELGREEYSELYQAIGSNFGSAAPNVFNLPDLRGLFVRCAVGNKSDIPDPATRDPDVASRIPLAYGGNRGNAVGSSQGYATRRPMDKHGFKSHISDTRGHAMDGGCTSTPISQYSDESKQLQPPTGGDIETRPDNRYVVYIIKYCAYASGSEVVPPVGAVLAYAGKGKDLPGRWLYCNGDDTKSAAAEKALYAAIGTANGSKGVGFFTLPDYRNAFLRGVDMRADKDRDAQKRRAPRGGNDKDRVGSIQDWATALPNSPFITSIPRIPNPTKGTKNIMYGAVYTYWRNNPGSVAINLTELGGDYETRPVNVGVNWLIQADERAALPAGSVIFAGMDKDLASEGWMPCDHSSLAKSGYPALYAAIGDTYGSDPSKETFNIPDYRGYFLRGAGTKEIDVDGTRILLTELGRKDDSWTGLPKNPIVGMVPCLPISTADGHGECGSDYSRENGIRELPTCASGGDAESRPVNVYLNAYIKVVEG
jgi:microcystin-dependent protein